VRDLDRGQEVSKLQKDQKRWDEKFREKKYTLGMEPNPFLRKHIRLLPRGKALDVAAGEGKNAVFLAEHGFDVEAVDISKIGLRKARKLAKVKGVKIKTFLADLDHYPIEKERYDLITDFYFLDRRLIPRIKRGLRKGGRVVFETYLTEQSALGLVGPRNPEYLLKPNELLELFKGFRILFYREGILREGRKKKAIASLIAEK
jgi:SAM-dependent methyltransferase